MTTIRDAEDAFLDAKAEAEEVLEEILAEWYAPIQEMKLGMIWRNVPEPVKAELRRMNPEAVEHIEKITGGG